MTRLRPDPDALLAEIGGNRPEGRGRLKVFLGAAPGVGKTYAMLEAARQRKAEGLDVVVGVVEAHGRRETEALLEGLEVLGRREVHHGGVTLRELDVGAALERRPSLLLVDELAHTNAPGSRHEKRWQDIEELLEAGIDVLTTVNVQHLESVNDVVAQITHVRTRETLPDRVIEDAAEVELVDLPPNELIQRLSSGKVYVPEQIRVAKANFFRRGNLIALRQLALRYTAEHVDEAMLTYRRAWAVDETWPVRERVLVGVGPAPSSQRLVRAAKRMVDRLGCDWHAVFVETPEYGTWPESDQRRVWETLRLAAELGAETASFGGAGTGALLDYARKHNVTKLVVGKPRHSPWRDRLFGSRLDEIIRASGDVDVHVTSGEPDAELRPERRSGGDPSRIRDLVLAGAAVLVSTVLAVALRERLALANLVMLYLLTVVGVAMRLGRGASVVASVLAVAAFDWFCVPPYGTFAVADTQYLPVFGVMLFVVLVISGLAARLRRQAEASRSRERRTAALLAASRELVALHEPTRIAEVAMRHVGETFDARVRVLAPDPFGRLRDLDDGSGLEAHEEGVAGWVIKHAAPAGRGTSTLPDAQALWVPLATGGKPIALLSVVASDPGTLRDPERMQLLETFGGQIAAALDRARLAVESRRAEHLAELSRLKSEFVAVAAHELRNPLNSLGMAVELLAERQRAGESAGQRAKALLDAALEDVDRLRGLSKDLLDLSRLEAGRVELHREAVEPMALLRRAVEHAQPRTGERGVAVSLDADPGLPAMDADPAHAQRALDNLVSNALDHAATGGRVEVTADALPGFVQISVADDGPGVPIQEQERIFEPFVGGGGRGGAGLGLSIAREVVRAHGGEIWVDSGPGPGAIFNFTLPILGRIPEGGKQPSEDS